jgi:phosphoglycolate phosphatase
MPLVVFDLDGTLIDSKRDLADSTNAVIASYGASPLAVEAVAALVGEGARVLVTRALQAAGLDAEANASEALDRFRLAYAERMTRATRPYEGIVGVLQQTATRAHLAVLSNKPDAPTHQLLDAFGLARYFRWVVGGDSTFPRKPDPAGLHFIMKEARATPEETLFVGDSMIDVQTSRNAGVRMCVALYGFGEARGDLELAAGDLRAADAELLGDVIRVWLDGLGIDDSRPAR